MRGSQITAFSFSVVCAGRVFLPVRLISLGSGQSHHEPPVHLRCTFRAAGIRAATGGA